MVVRRVATILAMDVVGYSRRMADDELHTLEQFHLLKEKTLYPAFAEWQGRIFKEMGDGMLVEFASVVNAVECANAIQSGASALQMRIGIHFGEIVVEGDDLFGDTVNIAARIESKADHGGVWLSAAAQAMVGNRTKLRLKSVGKHKLKNIPDPMLLYAVVTEETVPAARQRPISPIRAIAAAMVVLALGASVVLLLTGGAQKTEVATELELPGGLRHGQVFTDCATCPAMSAIAGGNLLMGAPEDGIRAGLYSADQGPQRMVDVAPFAIAILEITRDEFLAFLSDTGREPPTRCRTWEEGSSAVRDDRSFNTPGYEQSRDHPAVCVSWYDAQAYTDWLSQRTSQRYRLPSEAEWEYAARAGQDSRFSFGSEQNDLCRYDNVGDATALTRWPRWDTANCSDGRVFTAPVGAYAANAFGVHDIYGNVREWVQDCWHPTYIDAPATSAPWSKPGCTERVVRGGSWDSKPGLLASSARGKLPPEHRDFLYGFRVARDLK